MLDLDPVSVFLPETLAKLESALIKHEALVLHAPDLSPEQHLAIARYFGEFARPD